ncbi:hypothetical protein MN116_005107 [Schistosoma mekongi]|uniref:Nas2 N-terminal domain-containing protein n=1 Tax=Schistosoma mekongi TaxID=38744 RepID=A0AAE1ZD50_SCHME|nr:hypothetical protein MN116_005107 [Schistosoma mekongi]
MNLWELESGDNLVGNNIFIHIPRFNMHIGNFDYFVLMSVLCYSYEFTCFSICESLIKYLTITNEKKEIKVRLHQIQSNTFVWPFMSVLACRAADGNSVKLDEIKSKYNALLNEKNRIEQRLSELSQVLNQNGSIGLDTPLIDDQGYPRSDIDVGLIRTTRNSIRCLNTDHKQIMLELETILHVIHEYARQNPSKNILINREICSSEYKEIDNKPPQIVKNPFLKIDQIAPNSIAEQADLKVGDRVIQFGSVSADNFVSLQDISTVFRNTAPGSFIHISIIRGDSSNNVLSISLLKPAGNDARCSVMMDFLKILMSILVDSFLLHGLLFDEDRFLLIYSKNRQKFGASEENYMRDC